MCNILTELSEAITPRYPFLASIEGETGCGKTTCFLLQAFLTNLPAQLGRQIRICVPNVIAAEKLMSLVHGVATAFAASRPVEAASLPRVGMHAGGRGVKMSGDYDIIISTTQVVMNILTTAISSPSKAESVLQQTLFVIEPTTTQLRISSC
jgi:hypothetical protein